MIILSVCLTLLVFEVDLNQPCIGYAATYKHSTNGSLEGYSNQSWQIILCLHKSYAWMQRKGNQVQPSETIMLTLHMTVQKDAHVPIRTFSPHAVKLAYLYWRI